jgi:transposase
VFPEWEKVRVFVRPGATDLRKQINSLAALAQTAMAGDPLSGHLYLFSNQGRRLLKALYWDKSRTNRLPLTRHCVWREQRRKHGCPLLPLESA